MTLFVYGVGSIFVGMVTMLITGSIILALAVAGGDPPVIWPLVISGVGGSILGAFGMLLSYTLGWVAAAEAKANEARSEGWSNRGVIVEAAAEAKANEPSSR